MLYKFLQDESIQNLPLKIIYQYIYQRGLVSRADIIEHTNLNRGKVARSLIELLDYDYIQEVGHGDSEGGRPPTLYQINPISSYIIGIQITRFETRIELYDLNLNKLNENSIMMTAKHRPNVIMEEIKTTVTSFMNTHQIAVEKILGIGIGAIGPLDSEKGVILHSEPFLAHNWENLPIVDLIQSEFPVMVKLDNAANTIVLGESKSNHDYKNILNVTVGWTWGCGVILDGKLFKVESGDISGYGHMVINIDGKKCFCGKKGCMTAYSSLYAVLDRIKECSPAFYQSKLENSSPIDQVRHIVSEKDVQTKQVIMESAKYIGVGAANLATVFRSELVLVNGPLINPYPGYFEEIIYHASLNISDPTTVQFRKGNIQRGSLGAAGQIIDSFMHG